MTPTQIQQDLVQFIQTQGFNAPYGILTSQGVSDSGRPYQSITFGRPRTLDAEIRIFSERFLQLRHSRRQPGSDIYRSVSQLKQALTHF